MFPVLQLGNLHIETYQLANIEGILNFQVVVGVNEATVTFSESSDIDEPTYRLTT
jgi:hypothetical protein